MFKVTGKQRFGSVWYDGRCIAQFNKGVAHVNNPNDAEYLKTLGYAVDGCQTAQEPPPSEPDEMIPPPNDDPPAEGAQSEQDGPSSDPEPEEVPKMGVNPRRGRKAK